MIKTAALVFVLVLAQERSSAEPVESADSLLEEALFQLQVHGRPDKAAQLYEKIISGFTDDAWAIEMARTQLRFCVAITGSKTYPIEIAQAQAIVSDSAPLLLWRRVFGTGSINGLIAAGSRLAATLTDGFLVLIDPRNNGRVVWAKRGINDRSRPVYSGNGFLAVNERGLLTFFSEENGVARALSPDMQITGPLSEPVGDIVFTVSGRNAVAIQISTGKTRWERSFEGAEGMFQQPVVCQRNVVYSFPGAGTVMVKASTGEPLWRNSFQATCPPLVWQNFIILAAGMSVYALDMSSGNMIWNATLAASAIGMRVQHDQVFILDQAGELRVMQASTGNSLYSIQAMPGSLIVAEDYMAISDQRGKITCFNRDGREQWHFASGEHENMIIQAVGENIALSADNEGLFLLNARYSKKEDERLARSRVEIDFLVKNQMLGMAKERIKQALKNVSPGDERLIMQYASLLQDEGKKTEALDAWERFLQVADTVERAGVFQKISALTGADWVALVRSVGKFSPLYRVPPAIVALCQGEVNFLDEQTGRLLWKYRLRSNDDVAQSAYVYDGKLFCTTGQSVFCLDLEKRQERWRTEIKGMVTVLAGNGDALFAGTWNNGCYLIDYMTGTVREKLFESIKAVFPVVPATGLPLFVGLEGIVISARGPFVAYKRIIADKITYSPSLFGKVLVLPTASGAVKALFASNGTPAWEMRSGAQPSSFASDGQLLFVDFSNSFFAAFSLETGDKQWVRKNEAGASDQIVYDQGNLILASGRSLSIYAAATGDYRKSIRTIGRIISLVVNQGIAYCTMENGLVCRYAVNRD